MIISKTLSSISLFLLQVGQGHGFFVVGLLLHEQGVVVEVVDGWHLQVVVVLQPQGLSGFRVVVIFVGGG